LQRKNKEKRNTIKGLSVYFTTGI